MPEQPFGQLPADPEIRELAAACLATTATAAQWRRLEALITERPEVADFWVAHAGLHARLADLLNPQQQSAREAAIVGELSQGRSTLSLAASVPAAIVAPRLCPKKVSGTLERSVSKRLSRLLRVPHTFFGQNLPSRTFLRIGGVMAAAAAIVLLAWALWPERQAGRVSPPAIAWVDSETPPRALHTGDRVRQAEGQTELRFDSGVRLKLSGDAELELISAMAVRLHSGQLQADVGETGRGFRVLTDSTDVVDLGTVFGVGVNSAGETDVVVFQGEVELSQREGRSQEPADRRFTTGEAVRVEAGGNPTRIPVIWQGPEGAPWSTAADVEGSSVIASVGDNLSTVSRPKFYGVVPGGFRDGVKAYGDRTHVWSGVGEERLPTELLDGDYIQTFHDDRAETDFEIRLKVVYPAKIYVFIDDRVRAPEWVQRDFAETGRRVALSVKHTGGPNPRYAEGRPHPLYGGTLYEGYFQFPFSVWVREVEAERDLRLGPPSTLYQGEISWSGMYGIVAVPDEKDR